MRPSVRSVAGAVVAVVSILLAGEAPGREVVPAATGAEGTCRPLRVHLDGDVPQWSAEEHAVLAHVVCGAPPPAFYRYCGAPQPGRPPARTPLRAALLKALLTDPALTRDLPIEGVRIRCARFEGDLDLANHTLPDRLALRDSEFVGTVKLTNTVFKDDTVFDSLRFARPVAAENVRIEGDLTFDDSVFEHDLDLKRLSLYGDFRATGTDYLGVVDLTRALVDGGVYVSDHSLFDDDLVLLNAEIVGDFSGLHSRFEGVINAYGASVGNDVILGRAGARPRTRIAQLVMRNATVGGRLDLRHAELGGCDRPGSPAPMHELARLEVGEDVMLDRLCARGRLNMNAARVGGSVFAERAVLHGPWSLHDADIAGALKANEAALRAVEGRGVAVEDGVVLRDGRSDRLDLRDATIGGGVDVRGRTFAQVLDLSGAAVAGDLILGSLVAVDDQWIARWEPHSRCVLRNTSVRGLQDTRRVWETLPPGGLDMVGFSFDAFVGVNGETDMPLPARSLDWFEAHWFAKQRTAAGGGVAAEPYQQLSRTLRANGFHERADQVLVALNREKTREQYGHRWAPGAWVARFLEFGKAPENGLAVFGLVLVPLGIALTYVETRRNPRGPMNQPAPWTFGDRAFFTVDSVLPAVTLQKNYEEMILGSWVKYYFYFLRVSGYVFLFLFFKWVDSIVRYFPLF